MFFIVFIAIIVSKPLETIAFSNVLNVEIQNFKKEQIQNYEKLTIAYFEAETENIKLIIRNDEVGSEYYTVLLEEQEKEKTASIAAMKKLVANSNYYAQSIVFLNSKYPQCWILTLFVVFLFLYPAYQKRFIGEKEVGDEFNAKKEQIERELVIREYTAFKEMYANIFKEKFGEKFEFQEDYIDAPFNTKKKKDETDYLTESDLIADLYA